MRAITWGAIVLGVIVAVIGALVVEWLNRVFASPTCDPATVAWRRGVSAAPSMYVYGAGQAPQAAQFSENAGGSFYGPSCSPNRPAFAYCDGAPTPTYRSYVRIGAAEFPSQ